MISSTVFVIVLCAVLFPVCLLFGIAAYKNNKSKLISNREMGIGLVIGAVPLNN